MHLFGSREELLMNLLSTLIASDFTGRNFHQQKNSQNLKRNEDKYLRLFKCK